MLLPNKKSASSIAVFFMLSLMLVLQPNYAMADDNNTAIWGVAGAAGVVGVVLAALNLTHHWNKSENNSPGMLHKLVVTDPISFTSGDPIPLSVTAFDGDGEPIPDLVVTWSASGSGTITLPSPSTSTTGPNGIATIEATAARLGTVTVTATVGDIAGSTTFTIGPTGSAYSTSDIEVTGKTSTKSTGIAQTAIASIRSCCDGTITDSFYIVVYDKSGNPVPNVPVTWTATTATGDTGTAVFLLDGNIGATINTPTNASGTSTVNVMGQTKGNVTLTATVSTITPAIATLAVTLGLLDHIVITPTNPTIVSGNTQVLTAAGYDCNDNVITGLSFTWGPTGDPTVSLTHQNDTSGQITAKGLVVGDVNITATATDPTNSSITKTGGDDVTVTYSSTPLHMSMKSSSSTVASGSSIDITLTATDSSNNLIPGLLITLTSAPGPSNNASVTIPSNVTTESTGTATFPVTGLSAGSIIITATSGSASANLELDVTSGTPEDIAITSTTGSLEVASGAGIPLMATVIDSNKNPVQGAYVKWTTQTEDTGTATTPSGLTKTDANGEANTAATGGIEGYVGIIATVTDSTGNPVYNTSTQPITVTEILNVNAPGAPNNVSVNFDITPIASSKTTTAYATVTDSNGNLVADGTAVDWAWATYQSSSSVTLSDTSTTTSGGVAEVTVTGGTIGVVKIIATAINSSGKITKGQSLLNVGSGTPTTITIVPTVPAVTPISINSGNTQQFAVTVTDSSSNPLPGISITYSITNSNPSNALSLSTYNATTDSSGKATLTVTGKMIGTAYVTVTYSATLSQNSSQITVIAGAAKKIVLTIDNLSSSGTVVSSSTKQISASVTDVNGNPVATGTSVAWSSANTTIATVSPSSSTTSSGIATTTATGLIVGSTNITATTNGISSTIGLGVTVGPVSTVAVTPTTAVPVVSSKSATFTAKATDAKGNALKLYTINWAATTADTGTASLSGTTSNTDNSGNAIIQAVGLVMGKANIIATASTDSSKHGQGVLSITGPGSLSTISVSMTTPTPPANVVAGNTATFELTAKDAAGNAKPGVPITWSITSNTKSNTYSLSTLI